MAKCERCGKKTTFGHNRSFSQRATNRAFHPNLQKVMLYENGRKVKVVSVQDVSVPFQKLNNFFYYLNFKNRGGP